MSLIETPTLDSAHRAVDRERERLGHWRAALLLSATRIIACDENATITDAASPSTGSAVEVPSAPFDQSARPASSDLIPPAKPIASSEAEPARTSLVRLGAPIAAYEGEYNARLSVPEGWTHARLDDGKSGELFGLIARPTDKSAVVIVIVHQATHESLVEFGAERWLGISGGARDLAWGGVEAAPGAGDGLSQRRGTGRLWGKAAEVVQIRRRVPSAVTGPHTLLLLGAIANAAPAERREAYIACLASYAVSVP